MTVQWSDIDIDVVLDSGCSDHVMNVELDAPGYPITPSDGSRSGRGFIVGNGERIPNEGQATVNLRATNGKGQHVDFRSIFFVLHESSGILKFPRNLQGLKRLKLRNMDFAKPCFLHSPGSIWPFRVHIEAHWS